MNTKNPLLVFVNEPDRPHCEIKVGLTKIGRSSENDIRIQDSSISKTHCVIVHNEEGVAVYDFASRNGTWIGKIQADGQKLQDGDELRLGEFRLVFLAEKSKISSSPVWQKLRGYLWLPLALLLVFFALRSSPKNSSIATAEMNVWSQEKQNLQQRIVELQEELKQTKTSLRENSTSSSDKSTLKQNAQIQNLQMLLDMAQKELKRLGEERNGLLQRLQEATNKEQPQETIEEIQNPPEEKEIPEETKEETIEKSEVVEVEETKTETEKKPELKKEKIELSRQDLDKLMQRLILVIENYANPLMTPDRLEPTLSILSAVNNKDAAFRICKVYDHSVELFEDLKSNMEFLDKRVKKLLQIAQVSKNLPNEEKEKNQRLLELSEKKIEIQKAQQQRLEKLQSAVLAELIQLSEDSAIEFLATEFKKSSNQQKRKAILQVFSHNKSQSVIPILIEKLSVTALKDAILKTLANITGKTFEQQQEWENWWKAYAK